MSSETNPYHVPVDPDAPGSAAESADITSMRARLDARRRHGSRHILYLLAHARRAGYYIDLASSYAEIHRFASENCDHQLRRSGTRFVKRLHLVWCEEFHDEASARRGLAALRAMPHAWQRREVDTFNPQWLDLDQLLIGFPWLRSVGEEGSAVFCDALP